MKECGKRCTEKVAGLTTVHYCNRLGIHVVHVCRKQNCGYEWINSDLTKEDHGPDTPAAAQR